MTFRRIALLLCLLLPALANGCSRETAAEHAANVYADNEIAAAPVNGNLPDYSLPPDKLVKAVHLSNVFTGLHFVELAWQILQLVLLLWLGVIGWMRDRAVSVSRNLWAQGFVFMLLLGLARTLLNLPFNLYAHHVSLAYGFSVERWPAWFADLGKGFVLNWMLFTLLAVLVLWVIGKWPRRWWLVFFAAIVPIVCGLVYLQPVLVDPIFNRFEPLKLHHPELSAELARIGVPPARQFLMLASAKVTTPNAYVTGIGNTKRVVVWDTALGSGHGVSPENLWMVAHECGHYVLNHVLLGMLMSLAALPFVLYFVSLFLRAAVERFGGRWRIASQRDWGTIAILLLAWSLLQVVQEPVSNAISRRIEHHADIFGEEAIHGMVADPQAAVKEDMDDSGLRSLANPNPSRFVEFWLYDHPADGRRAAFGKAYDPWAPGMEPKYFKK